MTVFDRGEGVLDEFVEFGLGEAAGGTVDGFDEGAVDGNEFPAEESQ